MIPGKLRLLIVDDEPTLRRLLALAFRRTRWALDECATAEAAMQLLEAHEYDVLLVDKNLPGMSGLELVRHVRATHRRVAIVTMTGYGSVASATELLHLGVSRLLEKPFDDIATVIEAVDAAYEEQTSRGCSPSAGAAPETASAARVLDGVGTLIVSAPGEDAGRLERLVRSGSERVTTTATLAEALVVLERTRPDLVLVDAGVATEEVVAAVESLTRAVPDACIGVVAPRLSLGVIGNLIALGVRVLIEKPLDERQAAARLDPVLAELGRRRRAERATVVNG